MPAPQAKRRAEMPAPQAKRRAEMPAPRDARVANMKEPRPGDRINNYLLDEQVGSGSFGSVWRAHHHVFGEQVAVKIPTDSQYVRYLQRDAAAIHGLSHPNIVRALDLDPYDDPPYLIMEFVDGPSLRQIIDANRPGLPVAAAVSIMAGLLLA